MDTQKTSNRTCMCVGLDPDFFYLIQNYAERSGLFAVLTNLSANLVLFIKREQPIALFMEPERLIDRSTWDILRAIKADRETAAIPVILFSWLDEEDQALEAGVDVYVKKPVMYTNFLDALAAAGVSLESP
jgi:CheY-like chemotaxis protein